MRPNLSIEGAHVKGTETGSLVFSVDGRTLLTRGGDDTVKRRLFIIIAGNKQPFFFYSVGSAGFQKAARHAG